MKPEDARAIKQEVGRAQQGFTRQSATVISYRPYSGKGGIATVLPDGPNNTPIEAPNTTGVNLNPNDRVMLDFDPPAGVYILGVVTTPDGGGSCEPEAVRCHADLGCGGYEYFPGDGDYTIGGTTIDATLGLHLPDPGIWHIGFNMHGTASPGAEMGQGLIRVTNADTCTWEYGVTSAVMNPGDAAYITANGSVDHMVPDSADVSIDAWGGTTSLVFMSGFTGVLYAHRIECTDVLVNSYDCA